jgi:dsDNA-binding SOS-regulon protein
MNIDDFISSNKPRSKKSIFDEHLEDINKLLELNYSQKQVIEFLKAKCKNKTGLSEQNLSFYLRKSKNKVSTELRNTDEEKLKNIENDNVDKKPIDIFANLKGTNSKTSLE